MRPLRIYFFLFSCLALQSAGAQVDSQFAFQRRIPYPVNYFSVNATGELFTINQDNQLKKYNSSGDSVGIFNDVKRFGKLSYVEGQNPWKALLFYEDFQTVVMLDKYLKVLGTINLRDKNIFKVKAIANSYDNRIWLFDGGECKIKKLDDNGNVLTASVDLRQVFDEVPQPEKIIDNDGLLYLYDPEKGIYVFDYYGSFKKRLPFLHWKSIYISDKAIYGFDNTNIYTYRSPQPLPEESKLPDSFQKASMIGFGDQKIFVLKDSTLSIYKIL